MPINDDCSYPKIRKKNYFGKLVVVSHWSDFKLEDATKLGILNYIKDGYFYIADDSRGYRFCRLVSRQCIRADVSNLEQKAKDRINRDDDCSYPKILDNLCDNLERSNFLMWIQYATQDDIEVARKHNTEKLDELFEKYKTEIGYIQTFKTNQLVIVSNSKEALLDGVYRIDKVEY